MQVVVAEEEGTGAILAYWALVLVPHAEPVWVAPADARSPG